MKKNFHAILRLAVAALASGGLVTGVGATGAPMPALGATSTEELLHVQTPFSHPIGVIDAASITEIDGYDVVAYRIQNAEVAGEYAPRSDQTPEQFLGEFQARFGTDPEIVGATTLRPKSDVDLTKAPSTLHVEAAKVDAAPVPLDALAVQEQNMAAERVSSDDASRGVGPVPPAGLEWAPDTADIQIYDGGSSITFSHYYQWTGTNAYPYNLPNHYGIEFGVDLYTDDPITGNRPFCTQAGAPAGNYKDRPFAKNYGWSWYVYSSKIGTDALSSIDYALLGAYADYNDALDACNRSSISIGLANPWDLEYDTAGAVRLSIDIVAPQGLETSSLIGGGVQAVTRGQCEVYPQMTFTDCMGVWDPAYNPGPDPADLSRPTLGTHRNWRGPNICWVSNDFGSTAPEQYC